MTTYLLVFYLFSAFWLSFWNNFSNTLIFLIFSYYGSCLQNFVIVISGSFSTMLAAFRALSKLFKNWRSYKISFSASQFIVIAILVVMSSSENLMEELLHVGHFSKFTFPSTNVLLIVSFFKARYKLSKLSKAIFYHLIPQSL